MIDCSTLAGLLAHDHGLDAYCPRYDRWRVLDLAGIVREGKGSLHLVLDPGRVRKAKRPHRARLLLMGW